MSVSQPQRRIIVGRIAGAFGVRGLMRIESWTQPFDNLRCYNPWLIGRQGADQLWREYTVDEVSVFGRRLVARLRGINDRDEARSLYNAEIAVTNEQLPPLPEGEYYWFEIEGLRVVNHKGVSLGVVSHLMDASAHNVLVVRSDERERLIPYIKKQVVLNVDLSAGEMTVEWGVDW